MQETSQKTKNELRIEKLSIEDKQKLVGAFVWLIQEDKKQNPTLYKPKREKKND